MSTRRPRTSKKAKAGKGATSQTYYIDKIVVDAVTEDADADERSHSYIVNKILIQYYQKKGAIKKEK